jgi:multidrug resistance efflux pump
VIAALVGGKALWTHYQVDPWTRDGRVRADVVQVAPDVSGLVTRVDAANDQTVKAGQPLFYVDRERYALALRQADAAVEAQRAMPGSGPPRALAQPRSWATWWPARSPSRASPRSSNRQPALSQALAARDVAALNLKRTVVLAPTDGFLSDLTLRTGDYVTAGKPVLGPDRQPLVPGRGLFRGDQAVGPAHRPAGHGQGDGRGPRR